MPIELGEVEISKGKVVRSPTGEYDFTDEDDGESYERVIRVVEEKMHFERRRDPIWQQEFVDHEVSTWV